ncbi:L-serine ammonia-lyase [Pseudemcibacter aquimaris]|uniref:L-serine ammonia-lyase n=1 Tax=Pseudemcibacter aquimaris TaxID=2857064 RepID=UPI00201386E1|nr:L-serine ammonia-lyase [Pseudemcibacter aquimaris]MCC3862035.1 L-serine ammonia-lyase [Pseudemcibacter aquimaris]WDU58787.1 L-serine ammonia-lyase [Pseudemcibacter aquimaris]
MYYSVFNLFKIGVGPSSSHTVGPMLAAKDFLENIVSIEAVSSVKIDVYGSLALTGIGHATDKAILMGLEGNEPATIDPSIIDARCDEIKTSQRIKLLGKHEIYFSVADHMPFHMEKLLPHHSNGMTLSAYDEAGKLLSKDNYYSVGGGAIMREADFGRNTPPPEEIPVPHPFNTGEDLLKLCEEHDCSIAELIWENEKALKSEDEIKAGLDQIYEAMDFSINRGCETKGKLPGGLNVERRAAQTLKALRDAQEKQLSDPSVILDWINLWALAVNEENAAGGRVVTAPTNGAAGIIPAVLRYYDRFYNRNGDMEPIHEFLLTAAAIGSLYKKNASISGAEVGCQGEVGVACSMAAAGLAAVKGGTPLQVENAAEIGMEHNLGLTCDPIGGLVQIPCIERNAMGAVKAIDAARLAMHGDGVHHVSLDKVIETMRQTGKDMQEKYKETSKGGLAVNVVEC